jgi:hypothetical protein
MSSIGLPQAYRADGEHARASRFLDECNGFGYLRAGGAAQSRLVVNR